MTTKQMIIDVYEALGEPSDLAPYTDVNDPTNTFDITTTGAVKLLEWVNQGYERITKYVINGNYFRFPAFVDRLNFVSVTESDTAQAGSATTITLAAGASAVDDFYNDWVVLIDSGTGANQRRIIVDYNGTTKGATVSKDYTTNPDATSVYTLFKSFMDIVASGNAKASVSIVVDPINTFSTVQKLIDLENERELTPGFRTDTFINGATSDGVPDVYLQRGNRIYFNQNLNETRWYRMEYSKLPTALAAATDEPDMPSQFHKVLVLWATWWGLKRNNEHDSAWAVRQDIDHYMQTTITPEDDRMEREDGQVMVDPYVEVFGY
jgi:hypothetical protein